MQNVRTWFVADNMGNLICHDCLRVYAEAVARLMQEREPEAEWEAMNADDNDND
jgi:hypothetical protein